MLDNQKVCGIIGGLGPSATADLYKLIIQHTPAKKDQEHLRILIDSHPQIPDRTACILKGGESPVAALAQSAKLLQAAGADFLAVPCNTAHYFLKDVESQISIPFINMIEETGKALQKMNIKRAGLLSTAGTASTGIYQKTLAAFDIEVIVPSEENIAKEMDAIYGEQGIKAGTQFEKSESNKKLLFEVIDELLEKNSEAIILGCTELPLCLSQSDTSTMLINPTEILAQAIVVRAQL